MKICSALITTCFIALANTLPARAVSYDTLLNTPTMDPCHLFTAEADMVVLYLDMGSEGEVQISLPRDYLEDRADQQSGLRHGSVLLRVMLTNFLPVRRAQARRMSATQRGSSEQAAFITILIGDFQNLETRSRTLTEGGPKAAPNDLGLIPMTNTDANPQREIYVGIHPNGTPRAIIECSPSKSLSRRSCTHELRASGVAVVLDYRADVLPMWEDVQLRVERFLGCAVGG